MHYLYYHISYSVSSVNLEQKLSKLKQRLLTKIHKMGKNRIPKERPERQKLKIL
jgi:hypothetical protein